MTIAGNLITDYGQAMRTGMDSDNAFFCALSDNKGMLERIEQFIRDCSHGPTAQMSLKAYEQDIRAEATRLLRMFE